MGCGGSKAVRTKTAPAPVPVQPQTAAQLETNASQQRQQPEGKLTEETTATEGQQETQEKPETVEEDHLEGPVTKKQISLVQETWGLVKSDLEQVGVEFYIR